MAVDSRKIRYVRVRRARNGEFFYSVLAANNEVVYTSETFTRRSDAVEAAVREHQGRGGPYRYILQVALGDGQLREAELSPPTRVPWYRRVCRWLRRA